MRIAVVGSRRMVRGFALAGVKDLHIAERMEDAKDILPKLLRDPSVGIVIVPARFRRDLSALIRAAEGTRDGYPVVIALPESIGENESHLDDLERIAGLE